MTDDIKTIKTKNAALKKSNDELRNMLKESLKLFQTISVKTGPMKHEAYAMCERIKELEEKQKL